MNDTEVLVMTSANISGEPIIYKNDQALEKIKEYSGILSCYIIEKFI